MSTTAAFVPVTSAQAHRLRAGEDLGALTAYAAGPVLRAAHGLQASDDEEAGFVALGYAGLAALAGHDGPRLVLAADVDAAQVRTASGAQEELGEITVERLRWGQLTAVFADEVAAADDLVEVRRLTGGRPLTELADDDEVVGLVDRWDLLWFAPEELDAAAPEGR